jgi:hypothetical protein
VAPADQRAQETSRVQKPVVHEWTDHAGNLNSSILIHVRIFHFLLIPVAYHLLLAGSSKQETGSHPAPRDAVGAGEPFHSNSTQIIYLTILLI